MARTVGPSYQTVLSMPSRTRDSQPTFNGMTVEEEREAAKKRRLLWIQEQREKLRRQEPGESHPEQ